MMEFSDETDTGNGERSSSSANDSSKSAAAPSDLTGETRSQEIQRKARARLLREDMHDHVAAPDVARTQHGRLSRTLVNFWLDGLLAVIFVAMCIVAVIVQFVFPPGTAATGWSLWGLSFGQWCSVQFTLIAILSLGILVHVMLHWTWVCSVLTKRVLHKSELPDDGIRTIYGVGLLIGILLMGAIAVGLSQWMIVSPDV